MKVIFYCNYVSVYYQRGMDFKRHHSYTLERQHFLDIPQRAIQDLALLPTLTVLLNLIALFNILTTITVDSLDTSMVFIPLITKDTPHNTSSTTSISIKISTTFIITVLIIEDHMLKEGSRTNQRDIFP